MRSARAAYLLGASGVAVSTVASTAAGFMSLWLLTQILTKEMFGGYAFAMAIVALASFAATLGLDRSLLLRVARRPALADKLRGSGLAGRTCLASLGAGCVIAAGLAAGAGPLVGFGALPEALFWLQALAVAVMPMACAMILQAWFQANHRIAASTAMPGLGDLMRCLLFSIVLLTGLGSQGVAAAVVLGAVAPMVLLVYLAWGRTTLYPRLLNRADFAKGLQFLTFRLATQGVRQVDLIMMGLLATGGATAEYAIALRLAALADYGRQSLKPSFAPRARRWLAMGDRGSALREFEHARHGSLAVALAVAAGFVVLGPYVLGMFGAFDAAYPPMLLLALAFIVNAGFGMHASYLAMHGEVGWSAMLQSAALGMLVMLDLLLIPRFGAMGAATAALVTQTVINVFGAVLARRITGLVAIDAQIVVVLLVSGGALGLAAFDAIPRPLAATLLILSLMAVLARSRALLLGLARRALAGRPRSGPD